MKIIRRKLIAHKRITIGDIAFSYLIKEGDDQGGGNSQSPTVVFIHGFPFNKNMWISQLRALPRHVTGIAIDVRGHGNSTMGHGFFSIDVFARDLIVFLKKLQIEKSVLCGVSMGGYIALRAHQIEPEAFAGMILCDTHAQSDSDGQKVQRFDTIQSVLTHGTRAFSINFTEKVFSGHSLQHNENAVELIKSSIRRNNIRSICASLLAMAARTDTRAYLPHIRIPVLLVRGEEDQITPRHLMEEMNKMLPQSDYIELRRCGHLPNLEDPETFNRHLNEWFLRHF